MTVMPFALSFLAGLGLGTLYFAALWLSVRRLAGGAPARTLALSAILRLAMVLGALAAALTLGLPVTHLASAILGFFAARLTATRIVRRIGSRG